MTEKKKVGRPRGKASLAKEAVETNEAWLKNKPSHSTQNSSSLSSALQGIDTWKQVRKSYDLGHRNISDALAFDHVKLSEGSDCEYQKRNPQAPKFNDLKFTAESELRTIKNRIKEKASLGGKRGRADTFDEQVKQDPQALRLMTKLMSKKITYEFTGLALAKLGIVASTSTIQRWLKANRSSAH
jgi:hypothetical protein